MSRRGVMTFLSPLLALSLLAGLHAQILALPTPEDAQGYHDLVRRRVDEIPRRIGEWEGVDVPVPPAAVALLRPNAMFSRRYHHAPTGVTASLIIVQCRDARDMSGHFPPNCYPAHGWQTAAEPEQRTITVGGTPIPVTEFRFARRELDRAVRIAILNFFVLPTRGPVPGMAEVRAATGDRSARDFGAAQVQIVLDAGVPSPERERAFQELIEPLLPVLGAMRLQPEGERS